MGRKPVREWTAYDDGLRYTLWVVDCLLGGRADRIQYLNPPFAIDYAANERIYTQAPFQLFEWAAPGDGSYQHDSSIFFATGRGGLTMTAAAAAMRAARNANRRSSAARNSVPRWLLADQGATWISNRGFWIQTMQGLFPWPWESVRGMQVIHQGAVQIQGDATTGPVNWQVLTPAAELMFALWVIDRRVPHPQWMDRSWIPTNWIPWARAQGTQVPYRSTADIDVSLEALD